MSGPKVWKQKLIGRSKKKEEKGRGKRREPTLNDEISISFLHCRAKVQNNVVVFGKLCHPNSWAPDTVHLSPFFWIEEKMVNQLHGYLGTLLAVVCFGSYAVPIKLFPTGDGIVFQWVCKCAFGEESRERRGRFLSIHFSDSMRSHLDSRSYYWINQWCAVLFWTNRFVPWIYFFLFFHPYMIPWKKVSDFRLSQRC